MNDQITCFEFGIRWPRLDVKRLYLCSELFHYDGFPYEFVYVSLVNTLKQTCRFLQLGFIWPLYNWEKIISHKTNIPLRLKNSLIKSIHGVRLNKSFSHHQFDRLASFVQIDLSKKFLSPCKYYIYVTEHLFIICYLVVYYSCMVNYSFEVNLWVIDFCVHKVPVKVVKFIKIKRTFVIRDNVEEEHFTWIFVDVPLLVTFN